MNLTMIYQSTGRLRRLIEEIPGANAQAPTLSGAGESLMEAAELVLEANWFLRHEVTRSKLRHI